MPNVLTTDKDESLLEVIQFTGILSLISFGEIAAMANREDLVTEAQAMIDGGAAQVIHA